MEVDGIQLTVVLDQIRPPAPAVVPAPVPVPITVAVDGIRLPEVARKISTTEEVLLTRVSQVVYILNNLPMDPSSFFLIFSCRINLSQNNNCYTSIINRISSNNK